MFPVKITYFSFPSGRDDYCSGENGLIAPCSLLPTFSPWTSCKNKIPLVLCTSVRPPANFA